MKTIVQICGFIIPFIIVLLCARSHNSPSLSKSEEMNLLKTAQENFKITKIPSGLNEAKVALGNKLYLDERLSKSGTISCNSCHGIDSFGVDNEATSPGHDGRRGDRNSPTSFNAEKNLAQFWDGRAKDLAAQALGPLLNPIEHGLASEEEVLKILNTPEYLDMFKKAYGENNGALSFNRVGDAIAEFEKTLVTTGRWDEYLSGDVTKLSMNEKRGLNKFIEIGCVSCHYGETIGGQEYQKLGAVLEYETEDLGRYNVTKNDEDKHVFKVPTLRNIEKTYPYFHDGSIKNLDKAIQIMGEHQLGEKLSENDVRYIRTFLHSLTGSLVK